MMCSELDKYQTLATVKAEASFDTECTLNDSHCPSAASVSPHGPTVTFSQHPYIYTASAVQLAPMHGGQTSQNASVGEYSAPNPAAHCSRPGVSVSVSTAPQRDAPAPVTSQYRGVSWRGGQWEAKLVLNGRLIFRQSFNDEAEAASAWDRALRNMAPDEAEKYTNFKLEQVHRVAGVPAVPQQSWAQPSAPPPHDDGPPTAPENSSADVQVCDSQCSANGGSWMHNQPHGPRTASGPCEGVVHYATIHASAPLVSDPLTQVSHTMQRPIIKSSSVSTLLAATTLSESSGQLSMWPGAHASAGGLPTLGPGFIAADTSAMGPGDMQDMSAASLLLGPDGGMPTMNPLMPTVSAPADGSVVTWHPVPVMLGAAHGQVTSAAMLSAGAPCVQVKVEPGVGGAGEPHGLRSVGSAQDLAGSAASARVDVRVRSATRQGTQRAGNRRAVSKYVREKAGNGAEREGKGVSRDVAAGSGGRARAGGSGSGVSAEPQNMQEMLRIQQALRLGQERLHEQMRAHQAQHEEQQKRAAVRDAERRAELGGQASKGVSLAGAPGQGGTGVWVASSTSGVGESTATGVGSAAGPAMQRSSSGAQQRRRGPSMDESTPGGKVPRRIPSEPHGLAEMGMAGMGGRHQGGVVVQPATTRSPGVLRRVKSTHAFSHYQQPHMALGTLAMPTASPRPALKVSPSMPAFPVGAGVEPYEQSLCNIKEEDHRDSCSAPNGADADDSGDDLFKLFASDPVGGDLDLDLDLPGTEAEPTSVPTQPVQPSVGLDFKMDDLQNADLDQALFDDIGHIGHVLGDDVDDDFGFLDT